MRRHILSLVTLSIIATPFITWGALVPNCQGSTCQACDLMTLAQNILSFIITLMSSIIALVFVFGGMKMVMSAGDTGKVTDARHMMTNAVIGFVILLSAWLIIDTVMKLVVSEDVLREMGPWHTIQCPPVTTPAPPAPPDTVAVIPPTPGTVTPGTLSHADALALLQSKGVSVTSSQQIVQADCSSTSGCTSLQGIRQSTIDQAIIIKEACSTCIVSVTGGTESTGGHTGGASSHQAGYKIDIDDNRAIDSFLESRLRPSGSRTGANGGARYLDSCGNEYVRESTHWDISVTNGSCQI